MIKALYLLTMKRLIKQRQVLWWYILSLTITTLLYLFVYQFPLHVGSAPRSFLHLLSVVSIWFLPIFVVNDLHVGDRYDRDMVWLNLPIAPWMWFSARILAWLTVQVGGVVFALFWFIEGSFWYFFDSGLLLGGLLNLLFATAWTIALSFLMKAWFKKTWLALLLVYSIQFLLMSSAFFALVTKDRFPWLSQALEWLSYDYRVHNWQVGIFSIADTLYWSLLIYGMLRWTVAKLNHLANYYPAKCRYSSLYNVCIGVIVLAFLALPLELDMTANRMYTPHLAVKNELKAMKDPILLERVVSKEHAKEGAERWFMRRLLRYQGVSRFLRVEQRVMGREEAQGFGLTSVGERSGVDQFAGLLSHYHDLTTVESRLTTVSELDEVVALALRRLKRTSAKRLLLILDDSQRAEDFSLLANTLSREFDIEWLTPTMIEWLPFLEVDAYVVLGGMHLDRTSLDLLEKERMKGKGLWINTMGVRISGNPDYPPMRLIKLDIHDYLQEKGLAIGHNLLLDPDGYLIESGAGIANYPLWLSGRWAGNSLLSNSLVGMAPLMSVALQAKDEHWKPVVYSSDLAHEQEGYLEFNVFQLWSDSWQNDGQRYAVAREYVDPNEDAGSLVVVGSTTWMSDMVKDAQVEHNMLKALLMARYVTGDHELLQSAIRYNSIQEKKAPFAVHEMSSRYINIIVRMVIVWLVGVLGIMILVRRIGKE